MESVNTSEPPSRPGTMIPFVLRRERMEFALALISICPVMLFVLAQSLELTSLRDSVSSSPFTYRESRVFTDEPEGRCIVYNTR